MAYLHRLTWIMAASACLLAAQDDPPGRVAHLSYVYGAASFRPGDVNEWYPIEFNRPLTTGDHVFVDFAGTAELQVGNAAMRLGSRTTMDILNLDDANAQMRLSEGTLVIRVRFLGDQENFEVDTPNLAFSLLQPGEYRIDVQPDTSTTVVTVRGGQAQLNGPNQAFTVHPGEQVWVAGGDQPTYQTYGLPPRDTLDNFSLQRDQREDQSLSGRYCSREMVGYADLDRYGSWRETPEYGMVWSPNGMPGGWAPYHYGHWVWVDPWGWTWVDDAPWGFAPFHFGRWAYVGSWVWVPGPVAQRPVYAPALVAWVGGGAVGGGVGWFALGPREAYVPAYRTSPAYLNRVNVTNTVIVNNINITNVNVTNVNYVNRSAPGAVMAVQREAFTGARPVQSAAIAVRPDVARSAPVVAAVAVAPTRASVTRAPAQGANVVKPTAAVESHPVIAKKAPPPPPVPFAQKQAALNANPGHPLNTSQVQQLRQTQAPPSQPSVRQVQARQVLPQAPARSSAPPPPLNQSSRPPSQATPQRTAAPVEPPAVRQPPLQPRQSSPPTQRPASVTPPPPSSKGTSKEEKGGKEKKGEKQENKENKDD
ncbi:MAG TPA: DUF6600 domain-containing protein [Bryobacteraceae bacterium]|nr:DUF6600 domain-containing protein [Bryobacteraceae bacterium]